MFRSKKSKKAPISTLKPKGLVKDWESIVRGGNGNAPSLSSGRKPSGSSSHSIPGWSAPRPDSDSESESKSRALELMAKARTAREVCTQFPY